MLYNKDSNGGIRPATSCIGVLVIIGINVLAISMCVALKIDSGKIMMWIMRIVFGGLALFFIFSMVYAWIFAPLMKIFLNKKAMKLVQRIMVDMPESHERESLFLNLEKIIALLKIKKYRHANTCLQEMAHFQPSLNKNMNFIKLDKIVKRLVNIQKLTK